MQARWGIQIPFKRILRQEPCGFWVVVTSFGVQQFGVFVPFVAGKPEEVFSIGFFVTSVLAEGVVGVSRFGDAVVIGDGDRAAEGVVVVVLQPVDRVEQLIQQ